MNINKGLDELKQRFADPKFQQNEGLGNQIGVYIVSYNPKDEMTIRHFLESIRASNDFHPIEIDLYDALIAVLKEQQEDLPDLIKMREMEEGSKVVLEDILSIAPCSEVADYVKSIPHKQGDILILCGIGKVYPFLRLHSFLESLGTAFRDIPIVSFYPGKYDGRSLHLFDKFFDDNHYRSFDLFNLWGD